MSGNRAYRRLAETTIRLRAQVARLTHEAEERQAAEQEHAEWQAEAEERQARRDREKRADRLWEEENSRRVRYEAKDRLRELAGKLERAHAQGYESTERDLLQQMKRGWL